MTRVPVPPIHEALLCLGLLAFLAVPPPSAAQAHPLTLAQMQRLIKIHAPDDLVAREITTRGLSFVPDSALIERLATEGAGKATVAALKERIPRANLEIQAHQGSHIIVDSSDMGVVGPEGHIVLSGVLSGQHTVTVKQRGYTTKTVQVTLAANETRQLPVTLDWAGGYLTIKVSRPGATITIPGLGTYYNAITELPVQPGQYQVAVTQDGMKAQSRALEVASGQRANLEFSLSPDPDYVQNGLVTANLDLDAGNVTGAIQLAQGLLKFAPSNSGIEALLSEAYFQSYDDFAAEQHAAKSLAAGGKLTFKVFHQHQSFHGTQLHPAILTLTSSAVGYQPLTSDCKYQSFFEPLNDIHRVRAIDPLGPAGSATSLLELMVRDPERLSNKHSVRLVFAMPGSRVMDQGSMDYVYSPGMCARQVSAMVMIFQAAAKSAQN